MRQALFELSNVFDSLAPLVVFQNSEQPERPAGGKSPLPSSSADRLQPVCQPRGLTPCVVLRDVTVQSLTAAAGLTGGLGTWWTESRVDSVADAHLLTDWAWCEATSLVDQNDQTFPAFAVIWTAEHGIVDQLEMCPDEAQSCDM